MKEKSQLVKKLIIPLAGFGTRFAPSSTAYPKELTHLVDKPVLQYLIEEALESGIKEIIFIINSSKTGIKKYFSKDFQDAYVKKAFKSSKDIPIDLAKLHVLIKKMKFTFIEKKSTRGDGHSILFARPFIKKGEVFAVSMGDLLGLSKEPFLKQLINVYHSNRAPVISVQKAPLESVSRFGVIAPHKSKGRAHEISGIIEKPKPEEAPSRLIMTGKYILSDKIFPFLDKLIKNKVDGEIKLADALNLYAKEMKLIAYECQGIIQDTGNKVDFIKATINFALQNPTYNKSLKSFIKTLKI